MQQKFDQVVQNVGMLPKYHPSYVKS